MKRFAVIVCWMCVFVTAVFLRFDDLGARPFHADEATGARITARRMEADGGRFDPKHYHGPTLADLAIPICRMRGESGWKTMTKTTLRLPTAIAGTLLVLLPLPWRRRFGDVPVLLAGAFLATSPLLVYYSRMFIHESLLALFGIAALLCLVRYPRYGIPGFLIGLMFATKETFAISVIAWTGAALLLAMENRKSLDREALVGAWRTWRVPAMISILTAVLVATSFYTDGFLHLRGAVDAVRTFFVYETVAGHDKPFAYYFELLVVPRKSGGVAWFGTPLVLLALIAYGSTFRRANRETKCRNLIRFLAYAALGHFLIYSVIAYKTPWLACLPWAHVCLLAGFSFAGFSARRPAERTALVFLTIICLFTQFRQARMATGRLASDARNPHAYVPTRRDVETMVEWLEKLRASEPAGTLDEVAVIGTDYWPLPWYLRSFERVGYWNEAPSGLEKFPLVIAMPESAAEVMGLLADTHVSLPRGLRAGVPVQLFVRNDVWNHWMEADSR